MFALKILFLNFQGWLLFNYQCSFCCLFATACLLYLTCSRLSTTFLFFFFKNFCRFSTARIIYHNFLCLSTTFLNSFLFVIVVSTTTRIIYHNFKGLSTTLFDFFEKSFSVAYLLIHFKDFFVVTNNFFPCFLR